MIKLKWKVAPPPTGPYRSFEKRSWPSAYYPDGTPAAQIVCNDAYAPSRAGTGDHAELALMLADHSQTAWRWRRVTVKYSTLKLAQEAATRLLEKNPHFVPKEKP